MVEETIHGKIVAKREGMYTIYVIQCDDNSFRMCTKLPNWGIEYNLQIGDTGFLTFQTATAGEPYYNRYTNTEERYQYSNNYFKEFLKDNLMKEKIVL